MATGKPSSKKFGGGFLFVAHYSKILSLILPGVELYKIDIQTKFFFLGKNNLFFLKHFLSLFV
jgi:hypothetical protein